MCYISALRDVNLMNNNESRLPNEADLVASERAVEALVFAASTPVPEERLEAEIEPGVPLDLVLERLIAFYRSRAPQLVRVDGGWTFDCSVALAELPPLKPSKAKPMSQQTLDVLAIIAWHQPITTAEIDAWRGRRTGKSIIKRLVAEGWIVQGESMQEAGAPMGWMTGPHFLANFGWSSIGDLPDPDLLLQLRSAPEEAHDEVGPFRFVWGRR